MSPNLTPAFDISPECEAGKISMLRRQLFVTPPAATTNLQGKTALVVGANIGIGLECCRQMLELGLSSLVLGVRTEAKGQAARENLLKSLSASHPKAVPEIHIWTVDLSYYSSVVSFAERAKTLPIDIVVLNAGVVKPSFSANASTGHEETVQVNYLSTALLTTLLLPHLRRPARITIVNSDTSAWAVFKEQNEKGPILEALDKPENFDLDRYYASKLLGQLFLVELAKHVPTDVAVVNAVNPGLCRGSGLHRDLQGVLSGIMSLSKAAIGRTLEMGARCLTDAAVEHGTEAHGQYYGDGKMKPMAPIIYTPKGQQVAQKLWEETMDEFEFAKARDVLAGLKA